MSQADSRLDVRGEDAVENAGKLVADRQNLLQERGVLEVVSVGLIGDVGSLPGVSATKEIDGNDSQTPDICCGVAGVDLLDGLGGLSLGLSLRRHVEGRSTLGHLLSGSRGEAKVRQSNASASLGHENVFGLEIAVVDALVVSVEHGFQQLEQNDFGGRSVGLEHASIHNGGEEIVLAVLQNNVQTVAGLVDGVQRQNVRVDLDVVVKGDFAVDVRGLVVEGRQRHLLKREFVGVDNLASAVVELRSLANDLDGVASVGVDVGGSVDGAIGPRADHFFQTEVSESCVEFVHSVSVHTG